MDVGGSIPALRAGDLQINGLLKVYGPSGAGAGAEGGQIDFIKAATDTTLNTGITIDVYQNKLRFFEQGGTARGVSIDLSRAPAGVGGELIWKTAGYVDAGVFVQLDNIKCTVTTGGSRGLSVAAVSGSFAAHVSGTFGYVSGVGGSATTQAYTYTTTANMTGSWFGWSFPAEGDGAQYNILDKTNNRFYRVTMMIGRSTVSGAARSSFST